MLIFLTLTLASFFIFTINTNSHGETIRNSYINLILVSFFASVYFVLPYSFSSDHYEFFVIIGSEKFSNLPYKTFIIGLVSYVPINFYFFGIDEIRFLFFLLCASSIYFIGKKITKSSILPLFFFILPSVAIHSGLFLREPLIYAVLFIFIYYIFENKFIFSLIAWVFVFLLRPDSAILIFPVFLQFFKNKNLRFFLAFSGVIFTYLMLEYYEPLNFIFNSYRNQYDMSHNTLSNIDGLVGAIFNFFIGSRSANISTILLITESFLLLTLYFKLDNKIVTTALILIGIIILGSISDNSGFILRLRSVIVVIFLLMYFKERTNERAN